ncbi:unnamed protein product [Acanthosepion pharaonis]|uniref:Transmembrane protein n=1 Tax=Acanthosepion pharaonis TaxID=158019 RepID=A0A812DD50_ACAPH|nr:unnamed protein product [Sepia pharaonis]
MIFLFGKYVSIYCNISIYFDYLSIYLSITILLYLSIYQSSLSLFIHSFQVFIKYLSIYLIYLYSQHRIYSPFFSISLSIFFSKSVYLSFLFDYHIYTSNIQTVLSSSIYPSIYLSILSVYLIFQVYSSFKCLSINIHLSILHSFFSILIFLCLSANVQACSSDYSQQDSHSFQVSL